MNPTKITIKFNNNDKRERNEKSEYEPLPLDIFPKKEHKNNDGSGMMMSLQNDHLDIFSGKEPLTFRDESS